jgi:hypothetical protein
MNPGITKVYNLANDGGFRPRPFGMHNVLLLTGRVTDLRAEDR